MYRQLNDNSTPKKIDHIGIAVKNIEVASKSYALLGFTLFSKEEVEEEGVKIALLRAGDCIIELLEPLNNKSSVARFLERRGEGIHHVAFLYEDAVSACSFASRRGFKLIYEEPKTIRGNRKINFIHPDSTHGVLYEIIERLDNQR